MAESNTYVGVVNSTNSTLVRGTYQTLTSRDWISKDVQWACFTKTPFMKAIGVEGFGVAAMQNLKAFGAAQPTGRIIRLDDGVYALKGQVFATAGTNFHVGRLGTFNPELVEGGDEYAYSWHRLAQVQFIPDVDVQDNTKGLIDIKKQKMDGMKQKYVEGINYAILGNASAPDIATMGPRAVNTDLTYLIDVTRTSSVGGITKTATAAHYWSNQVKAIANIGGGGELDRPLVLRRSLKKLMNDCLKYAETQLDYLLLASQGAWQYYDRLAYADSHIGGKGGAFGTFAKYDAAGILNFAFNGQPMVWDPAVTVPTGATASTETIYGINIPTFFVGFRREEYFLVSDWELPREHDLQKTLVASIKTRYTPGVTAMRPQFVAYNMPACPD